MDGAEQAAASQLLKLRKEFVQLSLDYVPSGVLKFALDPMDSPTPLEGRQATQNSGLTALSPSPLNADFLANEGSLYDLQNIVHGLTPPREVEEERQSLLCRISSKLDALHAYKRQEWTRQRALGDRAEEEAQHALYRIHVNTGA